MLMNFCRFVSFFVAVVASTQNQKKFDKLERMPPNLAAIKTMNEEKHQQQFENYSRMEVSRKKYTGKFFKKATRKQHIAEVEQPVKAKGKVQNLQTESVLVSLPATAIEILSDCLTPKEVLEFALTKKESLLKILRSIEPFLLVETAKFLPRTLREKLSSRIIRYFPKFNVLMIMVERTLIGGRRPQKCYSFFSAHHFDMLIMGTNCYFYEDDLKVFVYKETANNLVAYAHFRNILMFRLNRQYHRALTEHDSIRVIEDPKNEVVFIIYKPYNAKKSCIKILLIPTGSGYDKFSESAVTNVTIDSIVEILNYESKRFEFIKDLQK